MQRFSGFVQSNFQFSLAPEFSPGHWHVQNVPIRTMIMLHHLEAICLQKTKHLPD